MSNDLFKTLTCNFDLGFEIVCFSLHLQIAEIYKQNKL